MALWGKTDAAASAPKNKFNINASVARGNTMFANTTTGTTNVGVGPMRVGVYGVSTSEAQSVGKHTKPGWTLKKEHTGPVLSITVAAAGTSFTNAMSIVVSGGTTNAVGNVVTNATGNVASIALTAQGAGFINLANTTVAVLNSTGGSTGIGTGATLTPVLGGKAGRVTRECLVAMSGAGGGCAGSGSTLT